MGRVKSEKQKKPQKNHHFGQRIKGPKMQGRTGDLPGKEQLELRISSVKLKLIIITKSHY